MKPLQSLHTFVHCNAYYAVRCAQRKHVFTKNIPISSFQLRIWLAN